MYISKIQFTPWCTRIHNKVIYNNIPVTGNVLLHELLLIIFWHFYVAASVWAQLLDACSSGVEVPVYKVESALGLYLRRAHSPIKIEIACQVTIKHTDIYHVLWWHLWTTCGMHWGNVVLRGQRKWAHRKCSHTGPPFACMVVQPAPPEDWGLWAPTTPHRGLNRCSEDKTERNTMTT